MQLMRVFFVFIFYIALAINKPVSGQVLPKDTSFTIEKTYIKELKKRPFIQIASPIYPDSASKQLNVVYKHIGKRELLLDIYYPRVNKKYKPAVLLIFGGGWSSGDKSHNIAMSTILVKNGYVAVSAEYRLTPEAKYPAGFFDLKDAIRWMKANATTFGIDTSKIAVLGCSAGGQLASLLGTTNGNKHFETPQDMSKFSSNIHTVVNIDGTLAFHHPESDGDKVVTNPWLGGTYSEATQNWVDAAPLTHVDSNTVPFLFINSSIPRFHAGRTDFIVQLNKWKIYSEVHEFDDTPHPFWFFYPWFDDMMKKIVNFLNIQFKRP